MSFCLNCVSRGREGGLRVPVHLYVHTALTLSPPRSFPLRSCTTEAKSSDRENVKSLSKRLLIKKPEMLMEIKLQEKINIRLLNVACI